VGPGDVLNPGDRYREGLVIASGETIYPGAAVGVRGGQLIAAEAATDFVTIGISKESEPKTAGESCETWTGEFPFAQTGTTITAAHAGKPVYWADDQTITLDASGRTLAGFLTGLVNSKGVWVNVRGVENAQPRIQSGSGTLAAGVLAVSANVTVLPTSRFIVQRVTGAGTQGDELRVPAADRTAGLPGVGEFTIRAFLNGAAATSDTSTVEWFIID
jgi:hypothetical protein